MSQVFDWDKAAKIIKESGCTEAEAGLIEDWFWTAIDIFKGGQPVCSEWGWLASYWATPVIKIGNTYHECYTQQENSDFDAHTRWPESALKILNEEDMR